MSTDVVGWTCNYNYLLQVIESINCNTICMQYAGPNKPLVFRTNDYEHLLMPVQRVEDKRTYEAEVKSRKERLAQATG